MSKPRLLDLFCGAGGAAMGYSRAGFEVVGVDINPQPHYPFRFVQMDALDVLRHPNHPRVVLALGDLQDFAAIHASPPCQHYSDLAKRNGNAHDWPDLIPVVRPLLGATALPWVIENVEGAPLIEPTMLCGTMFGGLRVLRHRLFESNRRLVAPFHGRHPLVFTRDKRKAHYGKLDQDAAFVSVNGGGNCSVRNAQDAMGIDWMTKAELNEAVPPAYTAFIGVQLLQHLDHPSLFGDDPADGSAATLPGEVRLPSNTSSTGVKDDNRPENLELWCTSQPAGIRAFDALKWAREVVARYEPIETLLAEGNVNAV